MSNLLFMRIFIVKIDNLFFLQRDELLLVRKTLQFDRFNVLQSIRVNTLRCIADIDALTDTLCIYFTWLFLGLLVLFLILFFNSVFI